MADLALLDLLQGPDAVPEWRAAAAARPGALSIDRVGPSRRPSRGARRPAAGPSSSGPA